MRGEVKTVLVYGFPMGFLARLRQGYGGQADYRIAPPYPQPLSLWREGLLT